MPRLVPDTTTLLFMTDSHIGANQTGFQQHPRRADLLPGIYAQVGALADQHKADLLIHGGDLTEAGTAAQIEQAVGLHRALPVAQAICLGNHDLATEHSLQLWRAATGRGGLWHMADDAVHLPQVDVLLLNTAWRNPLHAPFYWPLGSAPAELFLDSQQQWLEEQLQSGSTRPAVLVVHGPLDALPVELTGADLPLHAPQQAYAQALNALLDRHPRVKLVLSGHNHVTCATHHRHRVHLSTSSMVEPPFELRRIRLTSHSMEVQTLPIFANASRQADDAPGAMDAAKAWVNGRHGDRTISLNWN